MLPSSSRRCIAAVALSLVGGMLAARRAEALPNMLDSQDLVAVSILDAGQGILLATPGREHSGRTWRLRVLDTSALPQPLSRPVLSASGTKLCLQDAADRALVLDLTIKDQPDEAFQHVDPQDVAVDGRGGRHTHRLPSARFVIMRAGTGSVVDDVGAVRPESPVDRATDGASVADADADSRSWLDSLDKEALATVPSGTGIGDWQFFRVAPDPELYAPVLEVAPQERVFPGPFETLERLDGARALPTSRLLGRYLRQTLEARRKDCTIYFRVQSDPGAWTIEYWLYYPFDVGGLKGHLHDPEHVFVEVDKLGGFVRRVIGAGHGFFAGNNIYSATSPWATPVDLPLFVMVESNKHASAPDINRDGIFTPGVDENEYRERAKVWGVRDVAWTNNNHLLSYDGTMTLPRYRENYLASLNILARFPHEQRLAAQACCRLVPLAVQPPRRTTCQEATTECAIASVMRHPDFVSRTPILKEWLFPQSFLRATYGLGPGLGVHSFGIGYSVDLDRTPGLGQLLPLPGRVGAEVFGWKLESRRFTTAEHSSRHLDWSGVGYGFRYEQFLSNLFGIHSGVRVYSPPISDVWVTFGPMVEIPVRDVGNVNLMPGLSVLPGGSPRFEIRISAGFWKRRIAAAGIAAGIDGRR